jgi:hypothetical protein
MKHLFICSLQRSGTHYLKNLMELGPEAERFYHIGESLFNPTVLEFQRPLADLLGDRQKSFSLFQSFWEINPHFSPDLWKEVLPQFYEKYQSNGFISVKWFDFAFRALLHQFQDSPGELFPFLNTCFGEVYYLYLYREDKWKQAISLDVAHHTGRWVNTENRYADLPEPDLPFNLDRLLIYREGLIRRDQWWQNFFHQHHLPCFPIRYEDLCENYPAILTKLSAFLGTPIYIPPPDSLKVSKDDSPLKKRLYQQLSEAINLEEKD